MTTKETTITVVSAVVLIAAVYFMYTLLFPAKPVETATETNTTTTTAKPVITGDLDKNKDTLDKVKAYKDYGGAALDNIGRVNPFGPLN